MSVRLANPLLGDGSATRNHLSDIDPRALLLVAVGYVVTMLSVPVLNLGMLIWFAAYPVVMAPLSHVTYSRVFRKSLVTLPFILLIGVMNPLFDQRVAMTVCGVDVSAGWISFVSIIIRGLLSVQAALLLVYVCGFDGVCRAMGRLGLPSVMVTQLMMVSRYMRTLGEEAITMHRARQARDMDARTIRSGNGGLSSGNCCYALWSVANGSTGLWWPVVSTGHSPSRSSGATLR